MSANFRQRQFHRGTSSPEHNFHRGPVKDGIGHVEAGHIKENEASPGAGSKHNNDSRPDGMVRGHHMATTHYTSGVQGAFHYSVGLFPDVNKHVHAFSKAANYAGGQKMPGYYTSDKAPGVARGNIEHESHVNPIDEHKQGRTFLKQQHERWSSVSKGNRVNGKG